MAYPWFSIIALALAGVIVLLTVGAAVTVWRMRSLAAYRGALIVPITVVAGAVVGWIVFVSPVYMD